MIDNLSDNDILNYLMTSEFNEGLTPDEFRFLLYQFRNFYRIQAGRTDFVKREIDGLVREIEDLKKSGSENMNRVLYEKADLQNSYDQMKNRKLTWKERWSGKIILDDETK